MIPTNEQFSTMTAIEISRSLQRGPDFLAYIGAALNSPATFDKQNFVSSCVYKAVPNDIPAVFAIIINYDTRLLSDALLDMIVKNCAVTGLPELVQTFPYIQCCEVLETSRFITNIFKRYTPEILAQTPTDIILTIMERLNIILPYAENFLELTITRVKPVNITALVGLFRGRVLLDQPAFRQKLIASLRGNSRAQLERFFTTEQTNRYATVSPTDMYMTAHRQSFRNTFEHHYVLENCPVEQIIDILKLIAAPLLDDYVTVFDRIPLDQFESVIVTLSPMWLTVIIDRIQPTRVYHFYTTIFNAHVLTNIERFSIHALKRNNSEGNDTFDLFSFITNTAHLYTKHVLQAEVATIPAYAIVDMLNIFPFAEKLTLEEQNDYIVMIINEIDDDMMILPVLRAIERFTPITQECIFSALPKCPPGDIPAILNLLPDTFRSDTDLAELVASFVLPTDHDAARNFFGDTIVFIDETDDDQPMTEDLDQPLTTVIPPVDLTQPIGAASPRVEALRGRPPYYITMMTDDWIGLSRIDWDVIITLIDNDGYLKLISHHGAALADRHIEYMLQHCSLTDIFELYCRNGRPTPRQLAIVVQRTGRSETEVRNYSFNKALDFLDHPPLQPFPTTDRKYSTTLNNLGASPLAGIGLIDLNEYDAVKSNFPTDLFMLVMDGGIYYTTEDEIRTSFVNTDEWKYRCVPNADGTLDYDQIINPRASRYLHHPDTSINKPLTRVATAWVYAEQVCNMLAGTCRAFYIGEPYTHYTHVYDGIQQTPLVYLVSRAHCAHEEQIATVYALTTANFTGPVHVSLQPVN